MEDRYPTMSASVQSGNANTTRIIVDIADVKTTDKPVGIIATNILGACGSVAIYDMEARVGGLLHFLLPESRINPQRALANPYIFADTGIPMLFRRAYKLGAVKERILTRLVGGCNVMDPENSFNIGYRNQLVAQEVLERNDVKIAGKYLGGLEGMTVSLNLESGVVLVGLPSGEGISL
jgi:chemotaxis protein CheD